MSFLIDNDLDYDRRDFDRDYSDDGEPCDEECPACEDGDHGACERSCHDWEDHPDERDDDRDDFADPGGNSSLRASSRSNPRNLPCPTCGEEDVLTPADRAHGYQCNRCADQAERGF